MAVAARITKHWHAGHRSTTNMRLSCVNLSHGIVRPSQHRGPLRCATLILRTLPYRNHHQKPMEGTIMLMWTRVLLVTAASAVCSGALAVTGSTSITAVQAADFSWGYSDGCAGTPVYGSASSETLSDGRKICGVSQIDTSMGPGTNNLAISISGFTADPGQAYINNMSFSCLTGPTSFSSSTAFYLYDATNGIANWFWDEGVFTCIGGVGPYNMSLN